MINHPLPLMLRISDLTRRSVFGTHKQETILTLLSHFVECIISIPELRNSSQGEIEYPHSVIALGRHIAGGKKDCISKIPENFGAHSDKYFNLVNTKSSNMQSANNEISHSLQKNLFILYS